MQSFLQVSLHVQFLKPVILFHSKLFQCIPGHGVLQKHKYTYKDSAATVLSGSPNILPESSKRTIRDNCGAGIFS